MPTLAETREFNRDFLAAISDPRTHKQAAEMGEKVTRFRLREEGFMRKFLPPTDVQDSDIAVAEWTDQPRVVREMEPDAPAAITVSYGGTPNDVFIRPKRYAITGVIILSPRVGIFKQLLRTYQYDVKKVWADNIVKDTMVQEDAAGIETINAMLLGADTTMYGPNGVAQWRTLAGGISRSSVVEANKTLYRGNVVVPVESALATITTLMDFMKWDRNEAGGDIAMDQLKNGWTKLNAFGLEWYGTIKRALVPDNTVYYFAPVKFLGASLMFDPMKMYIDEKYGKFQFHTSHEIGTAFANTASVGRVDFTP